MIDDPVESASEKLINEKLLLHQIIRSSDILERCIPSIDEADKKSIEDASSQLKEALKGENTDDIKKKTEALVQASMKLGEAIYKSQQNTKPDSNKDDGKDDKGKKEDNVVDADFEEVKDENKEKSA